MQRIRLFCLKFSERAFSEVASGLTFRLEGRVRESARPPDTGRLYLQRREERLMKRFTLAFGLINAGLAGCTSTDSRVGFREEGLSEYKQVASDQESSTRPGPLVARWQKMIVRIRE